ncbi:MAG: diacylglycerol kinase [Acidimicrobiales bacterium]|nr:MAG: diacylglycerol kinase [Acidimicrobiales bacterium]
MKVMLLVNTTASSVTPRVRIVIQKALAADHEVEVRETNRRGHATRLAQKAAAAGVDVLAVLGGDGTLNEAANGLVGSETALAPLPGGSTNVFCRILGLPDDPVEATGSLLDSLARGDLSRIGVGTVNGRYFLFHVGCGFDAEVVRRVEMHGVLKRYASHALFAACALAAWWKWEERDRPRMAVSYPDGTVCDDSTFTIVFNANPYTYLGTRPFQAAPDATLDRPLAALSFRSLHARHLLPMVLSALMSGERMRRSKLTDYRTDLDSVRIKGYGPFPYQVDGDYLGETEELDFSYEPEALKVVMP